MQVEFPQYRKYSNNNSYFKLISPFLFEELSIMGNYYHIFTIPLRQLPERNLFKDLMEAADSNIVIIAEDEYSNRLEECKREKMELPVH